MDSRQNDTMPKVMMIRKMIVVKMGRLTDPAAIFMV
jgi:hypothetical protein